ncbi:MAG: hypothetical protein SPJ34_03470 [Candidatus Ornithospirochaeta sp.]|nr:hypothetical protein [Candidatus Ornithospirochaeta sp.]
MIDAGSAFGNDIRNAYGSKWITIMESESSAEYLSYHPEFPALLS